MSAVIRWEAPPPQRGGRGVLPVDHGAVAAELRSRPLEWAVIATGAVPSGMAHHIKSGRIAAYRPAGAFEATRQLVDGEPAVYARFVGEVSS